MSVWISMYGCMCHAIICPSLSQNSLWWVGWRHLILQIFNGNKGGETFLCNAKYLSHKSCSQHVLCWNLERKICICKLIHNTLFEKKKKNQPHNKTKQNQKPTHDSNQNYTFMNNIIKIWNVHSQYLSEAALVCSHAGLQHSGNKLCLMVSFQ